MAEDTPDEVFLAALEAVAPERWATLWDAVDAVAAEAEHATWAGGQVIRTTVVDGVEKPVRQMPYPVYSEAVQRLRSLVGELGLVVVFDWMQWDGTKRYAGGQGLAEAPAADAVRMITATFRAERFVDGAIDGKLADGTLPAAFARLRRWHTEHAAGATAAAEPVTAPSYRQVMGITPGTAHDRAVGALLGLAVGDAVGTTLEFKAPGTFEPITDMVGGGPFGLEAGQWTDDTSMALCLAESILDTGGPDLADQMRRYVLWQTTGYLSSTGRCFDIGNATSKQLNRFRRTGEAIDPHPDDDAAANGSLMRLAPVPIRWHADPAMAAEQAATSSRPTHAATRPLDACRVMAAMTASLIGGAPADDVLAERSWRWGDLHPEVAAVAAGSWRGKEPPAIRGTGYCVDALEAALWAVAGATDFRDAVLRAANLGDDADTTAAIAGQLAGARWGASGIPEEWRAKVTMGERICELATGLFRAGGGEAPVVPWPHDEMVHAYWVVPGELLAGEYPGNVLAERAAEKVNLLVDAGVRTFVDLTEAHELAPYAPFVDAAAETRKLDLLHHRMPIRDLHVVDDAAYDAILDLIHAEQARGAVYVHCWGGRGRTGTVVGCLLARDGHDYDTVIAHLAELRKGSRKAMHRVPESDAQHEVLRRRTAR